GAESAMQMPAILSDASGHGHDVRGECRRLVLAITESLEALGHYCDQLTACANRLDAESKAEQHSADRAARAEAEAQRAHLGSAAEIASLGSTIELLEQELSGYRQQASAPDVIHTVDDRGAGEESEMLIATRSRLKSAEIALQDLRLEADALRRELESEKAK